MGVGCSAGNPFKKSGGFGYAETKISFRNEGGRLVTLHLISHTHWDREWYRPYQDFRLRLVQLVDGLLDLLAKDPSYKYFMLDGQTIVLEDYLEIRPEREAELRRHIRSGRILIGPWHILPDEFLVSPEATIRNFLEGARACRRFGSRMPVGYTPDPFGHIGQLPQILRGFGIGWSAFCRGLADEPCELWWDAPDGSRVLAAYLRDGYDNAAGLPTGDAVLFAREVSRRRDSLKPHSPLKDLLLMHGTDHMEPPIDTSAAIRSAAGRLQGDRLIHSTLPIYFRAVESAVRRRRLALPVVRGELRSPKRHPLLPGVTSARMWIKQRNRECETLLERWAEPFSAWASAVVAPGLLPPLIRSPQGALHAAWRMLMQNHPHDSICGCSIDEVYEEMRPRFAQASQIGEEITRASLDALAGAVDTRAAEESIIVFQPVAGPQNGPVEVDLHLPVDWDSFEIADSNGSVVPHQAAAEGGVELINIVLDRDNVGGIIGNLHDGQAGNLSVRDIRFRRRGGLLHVDAVMAENSSPDPAVWKRAVAGFREYLADPGITKFHIRARNAAGTRALFAAPGLPGYGWKTFSLRKKSLPPPKPLAFPPLFRALMPLAMRISQSRAGMEIIARMIRPAAPPEIENEFFRVRVEDAGTLEIFDKRTGARYGGQNAFLDGGDCGDSYNYCPPARDWIVSPVRKAVRVQKGPVRRSLEIDLELLVPAKLAPDRKRRSADRVRIPITSRATVYPGVARVEIHTAVENHAQDHRLRVHFPFPGNGQQARARYDGHFEIVERPSAPPEDDSNWIERWRPEVPQRIFTDLSTGRGGLMTANRGLPEVEAAGGREIALTLLRCVGWLSRDDFPARSGHAGPMLAIPGAQMEGRWEFDYAVIPHGDDFSAAVREARAFEAPPRAVQTGAHAGALPPRGSMIDVSPAEFEISAMKLSEDGRGILVRGWNSADRPLRVTVRAARKFERLERVNLAEEGLGGLPVAKNGEVTFAVEPSEIVTVIFREKIMNGINKIFHDLKPLKNSSHRRINPPPSNNAGDTA
jgi:mannosylglycerate hydrolase